MKKACHSYHHLTLGKQVHETSQEKWMVSPSANQELCLGSFIEAVFIPQIQCSTFYNLEIPFKLSTFCA